MSARAKFPASIVSALKQNASLRIRAGRAPHRFLGIWSVAVGDRVFVRTWNDKPAGWYRAWRNDPHGAILVGTREIPVRAVPVRGARLLRQVSAAYIEKYCKPGSLVWARGMDTPERRATTLELVPRRGRTSAQDRGNCMAYAIKVAVADARATTFTFDAQKTMYGGKRIAAGDTIFIFASETRGGTGLIACGIVTAASSVAKRRGVARQTPRVSVSVRRTALAKRRLGRRELTLFRNWKDGRPETELNFKFYRQATDKIVGISDATASFLRGFF